MRLLNLFRRRALDRELDRELRAHLDLLTDENRRAGMDEEPARRAALLSVGGVEQVKEDVRDARFGAALVSVGQDLRYALRGLRKAPWFAAAAVLALALGIGANAAIFSVVNAVLLRPLPYRDSDRLVVVLHHGNDPVAPANFFDWRGQSRTLSDMAAAESWAPSLSGVDQPERIPALRVSANLLSLLGVEPIVGRGFVAGEDESGREHVLVIGYGLWQRRFGGDRGVIGRTVLLDGQPYTIIGVMPRDFRFAPFWVTKAEMWAPLALGPRADSRRGQSLRIFARLRDGVPLERARAEISAITARLEAAYPGTNEDVQVVSLKEKVVGDVRPALLVLLGAVGFLLLIACANVAHMLLARTAAREREISVRYALGARRARLVRQFLTENLLLALLGGGAGLLLAYAAVRALPALAPGLLPRMESVRLDTSVLLFTLGASLATAILFGLAPALQARHLSDALKQGGRGATQGGGAARFRGLLVASEFALALVLLVGAGLMIRSFAALTEIDPGFRPGHVLTMVVTMARNSGTPPQQRVFAYQQLLERVRALPGVASAGAINHVPLVGDVWHSEFYVEGQPIPDPNHMPRAAFRLALPGYFHAMQIPLLRGRDLSDSDLATSPAVAVINQRLANLYWPGEDAIGKRFSFDNPQKNPQWITVAGIIKDTKQDDWAGQPDAEFYLPLSQDASFLKIGMFVPSFSLVVRAQGDAAALMPSIAAQAHALDKDAVISSVITLDDAVSAANARPRLYLALLGAFAAIALCLAAVGIYGVMSYAVSRRTHEIGLRVALGASRRDVLRLVVGQGMAMAFSGAAAGLAGAFLLSRLMAKLLYGVRPTDPLTFALVPLLLGLVALAANYLPARRALRINPIIALRQE